MLDEKTINDIANLARLGLSAEEKLRYGKELSLILDYVSQLQELNIDGIEPTAQITGLKNVWREDYIVQAEKNIIRASLQQAAKLSNDNQVEVERILE